MPLSKEADRERKRRQRAAAKAAKLAQSGASTASAKPPPSRALAAWSRPDRGPPPSPRVRASPLAKTSAVRPACEPLSPPPRGVIIPGARPGRGLVDCGPGYPLPPDEFTASPFGKWQANVEAMLAALAAKNDAQERRIAALEKTVAFNEAAGQTAKALARAIGGLLGVRLP